MKPLVKSYDYLIHILAVAAMISIIALTGLILADVTMRYLRLGSIQSASTLIEYALLFSTMLGAPWLVRKRGHITVTSMVDMLPPAARRGVGALSMLISIVTLGVLGWRSARVAWEKWIQGSMDVRSVAVPEWIAYAILATGFLLMATETLRLMMLGDIEPAGSAAT